MEIVPAGTVTKIMFMKIDYDVFIPIGHNFDYDFFTATNSILIMTSLLLQISIF